MTARNCYFALILKVNYITEPLYLISLVSLGESLSFSWLGILPALADLTYIFDYLLL